MYLVCVMCAKCVLCAPSVCYVRPVSLEVLMFFFCPLSNHPTGEINVEETQINSLFDKEDK